MIFFEFLTVLVAMGLVVAIFPQVQGWVTGGGKGTPAQLQGGPDRLMARIVQPDPFPSTVSAALPVTVMVLTVGNGEFRPEIGATVSFSLARGNALANGSRVVTQPTDQFGSAMVLLTAVRSGEDELVVSVMARGSSMPVGTPLRFATLG